MALGARILLPVLLLSAVGLSAQEPSVDAQVASAKTALARYQDPIAAVHDGYFSTVSCIDYPTASGAPGMMAYKAGAMGVHFLNTGLIGPTLDPTKPQVLIYEPNGDKLQLVGAEWFTPVMPGIKEAPKVFGKALEGPMEGHAPIMPNGMHHWDLHVWLWKNNPNGMFSRTNPDVKCP